MRLLQESIEGRQWLGEGSTGEVGNLIAETLG